MPKTNARAKNLTGKPGKKPAKAPAARMTLKEVMTALEKAGSVQTRKTYARHGAKEPMFGVSFGYLKTLVDRIKIDQELAEALWDTGNYDARNLAAKIADPANMSPKVLDRWAATPMFTNWGGYVGQLAAESPHRRARADKWLAAKDDATLAAGWAAVGAMAMIDESTEDAWFERRLAQIEKSIGSASNMHRSIMNRSLITIGCRDTAFRKLAIGAAKRIGAVAVDHGDTECKTPDAVEYIEKAWERAKAKGFASPAAQERARESMRTRC